MLYFLHKDVCVWPGNVQVGACFWALPFPEDARTFDLKVGGEVRIVLDNEARNGKEDSGVYSSADAPMLDLCPWRKRFFLGRWKRDRVRLPLLVHEKERT